MKKYGPDIIAVVSTLSVGVKKYEEMKEGNLPYRVERYNLYKTKILNELDNQNRNKLFQYKLEIEQFIQQIENEKKEVIFAKRPKHDKDIKKWNDILLQIKDKMSRKDYQEFINIYNNPNYQSEYFKGFECHVERFKKLNNGEKYDDLLKYIAEITSMNVNRIKEDFPLKD